MRRLPDESRAVPVIAALKSRLTGISQERFALLAVVVGVAIGLLTVINPMLPMIAVVGAVVGILALYFPEYTVPVVFTSILLEAVGELGATLAGLPITLSKLAVLGAICVWGVRAVFERRSVVEWLPISWGMVAVVASMVVGVGVAGGLGRNQVLTTFGVVMVSILTHLVAQLLPVARLTWLLRIMGLLVLGVLLVQLRAAPVTSVYDARYTGAFLDPNMWSMTLLLIVPIVVALMAEEKSQWWTVALVLLGILFALNIFQSLSRAGMLATVMAAPFLVWLSWRRRWAFIAALALVPFIVGFVVNPDALIERYQSLIDPTLTEADGSLQQRGELARTAWVLFKENLLIGIGQGRFIDEAMARTNGAAHLIAHNTYLTIAAELGLYGLIAHAFFFFLVVRQGFYAAFRAKTRKLQRLVVGYAVAMLCFAAMSATLNNMTFSMAFFILGVFMVMDRATYLSVEELEKIDLGDAD